MSALDLTAAVEAGFSAAWPGLPAGMPLDEARRRSTAAVSAAAPLIEAQVREQIAAEIEAAATLTYPRDRADHALIRGAQFAARITRGV